MYGRFVQRCANKIRRNRKAKAAHRPQKPNLSLESLEDRLVPAVFNVNSLADLLTPPSGAVTLRSAIQQANQTPGGNTINLTVPGVYKIALAGANEDANTTGDFDILAGGNLTIDNASNGAAVIDGGNQDRIFDINPNFDPNIPAAPFKVTLMGLTLQHGNAVPLNGNIQGGGAIQDTGNASLELDNCVIANNSASGAGGGILMQNTVNTPWTLTANNSVISNNHANDAGGGIDTIGQGKVFVTNSQLVQNTCVNQGAAIWLDVINDVSATLTLASSLVSRNDAFNGPTGALGSAGNGSVTINSSTVSDNYSGTTGGGFGDENMMANVSINNSQFLNNVAMTDGGGLQAGGAGTTTTITNSVFAGNTAGGNGGGFFASGGAANISNSQFTANTATFGGGIEDQAVSLALSSSEFDNNRAISNGAFLFVSGGGALDAATGVTSVTVANCLFVNNAASDGLNYSGGAIDQSTGNLTVTASQFTGNSASNGGALNFSGNTLMLSGSTFDGNSADGQGAGGGALAIRSLQTTDSAVLTNDTFTGNSCPYNFGGAVSLLSAGSVQFLNDTITGNSAGQGGGLSAFAGSPTATYILENTIVALNTAPMSPDIGLRGQHNPFVDGGGNFIGNLAGITGFGPDTLSGNPKVGLLQNNGGPLAGVPGFGQVVQTEALLPGSPAIGAGVAIGAPAKDERGFPRPAGGRVNPSIGAYEPHLATNASTNQILVENLFEVLLGRLPDPGSAGFVNELANGTSAGAVALQIEGSSEYLNNQVQLLYQRYLHRQADSGGLQSFVSQLSHGATLEHVAAVLIGSQEYFQLHGSNNISFINALYLDALSRTPDPFGQDAFSQMLAGGASHTSVALAVLGSPEYQSNLVVQGFAQYLGRQAFPEDITNFTAQMQKGLTDQALVAILAGSTEFLNERT